MHQLKTYIRDIPDFPIAGVTFKDISPLLQDPLQLQCAVNAMIAPFSSQKITAIAANRSTGLYFWCTGGSGLECQFYSAA